MGAVSSGAPEFKIINGKCQQESGWTVVHLPASHVRDVDNDIGGMRGKSSTVPESLVSTWCPESRARGIAGAVHPRYLSLPGPMSSQKTLVAGPSGQSRVKETATPPPWQKFKNHWKLKQVKQYRCMGWVPPRLQGLCSSPLLEAKSATEKTPNCVFLSACVLARLTV